MVNDGYKVWLKRCFYIALFLFVSCKKQDTFCWQCQYYRDNKLITPVEYCDKTEDSIKAIERGYSVNGAKMSCAKKY